MSYGGGVDMIIIYHFLPAVEMELHIHWLNTHISFSLFIIKIDVQVAPKLKLIGISSVLCQIAQSDCRDFFSVPGIKKKYKLITIYVKQNDTESHAFEFITILSENYSSNPISRSTINQ